MSSGSNSTKVKEETVIKQENLPLADTIRRLAAGCEGITGDFQIKKRSWWENLVLAYIMLIRWEYVGGCGSTMGMPSPMFGSIRGGKRL